MMSEYVRECWKYEVQAGIRCVGLSRDGQFIFAGGLDQRLYCFDRSGHLLWRSSVEGIPMCLTIADGCERVLVGCSNGTDSKAYVWNYQQQLLYTFETAGIILGASITPTAHRIALRSVQELQKGSLKHSILLFDSSGTLLWVHNPSGFVRRFSITSDGQALVLGSENHHVYLLNHLGEEAWNHELGASVWAGAQSADTSAAIVAGANDYRVYLFGSAGKLRWSYNTGGNVNAIAITPDGRFVTAACNAKVVFLFDETGNILWKYSTIEDIYGLLLSNDGRFVLAQSQQDTLTLLDSTGTSLWTQPMQQKVYGTAMTPNGRLLAIAQDDCVSLVENLLASEDMSDARTVQTALSQIRRAYGISPYMGITAWFEAFDHALLRRELDLCRELLQEVHSSSYHLSPAEQNAVTSREGSFLLYQGLRYQQHGETEQARRAYEQSREIQQRLHYQLGEGQALSALHALQDALDETAPALNTLIVDPPELLENSQLLLAQCFASLSPSEQYQAVETAKQKGYLAPLLEALSSPHSHVQSAAITALTWLQPGPETSKLLVLLTNPQWMVRWLASTMLSERAKEPLLFAPYRERVRQVMRERLSQEQDPFVRRALAILLTHVGDITYEPLLLPLLQDVDPNVRGATIKTLGLVGTRQVIAPLLRVKDGNDFAGRPLSDFVQFAIQRIGQRHPLAQVQKVVYCQELTEQEQPVNPATRFLTLNPIIHCVVTVAHPTFGTRVSCTIESPVQAPMRQVKYLKFPLLRTGSNNGRRSLRNWLQQLLSEEDAAFWAWRDDTDKADEMPPVNLIFSYAPPRGTWSAGVYTVEISLDEEIQYKHTFQVVNFEAMTAAPIHYRKGCISHGQKRYQEALVDYAQAKKFDPQHINAWCSSGDVLIVRGLLSEASDAYAHAMQLDSNAVLAHFCSDGLLHLLELNHYEGILTSISLALLHLLDPTFQVGPCPLLADLYKAAESALLEGKEGAFVLIEEVTQGLPVTLPDHFAQAIAFALTKRKNDALAILDQSLLLIPNSALAPVAKAMGLALLEQSDEALASLDQALSWAPNSIFLVAAKAIVSILLNRKADALVIIDQMLRAEPGLTLLYIFRGFLLFQLGRREEILATSERVLRLDPDSSLARLFKGVALLLLDREEGFAIIKQVIDTTPDFLLAHLLAAVALSKRAHLEEALTISEQIIQRLPNFACGYFLQGHNFMANKQYTDAANSFDRAIQLGLKIDRAYKGKGDALSHLMRYEEALAAYEWAVQLCTSSAVYHSDKGNILIKLGKYTEALETFEEAIRLDSSYTLAYQGKTKCLKHLGKLQEAKQASEKGQ